MRPIHASDIRNGDRCLRLAALSRRAERKRPRGKEGAKGQRVHAAIERYVATGELPDEQTAAGRIALELVPWVPRDALGVEVPFSFVHRGIVYEGRIDLVAPGLVRDWKTTSDWKNVLPTLAGEVQPVIYAAAYHAASGEVPTCSWVYVHTSSLQVRELPGRVDPSGIEAFARRVDRLLEADQIADPLAIPGNRAECKRYGGCDHRATCGNEATADRFARVRIGGAR